MAESVHAEFNIFEFLKGFEHVKPFLEEEALKVGEEIGEAVVEVAKSLAPVDTDALQEDIKVQGVGRDRRGVYVDVGTREPYALYQEFGTVHNPAHPFMRPAIAQVTGGAGAAISNRLALARRRRRPSKKKH